jgi:hypothetical protein
MAAAVISLFVLMFVVGSVLLQRRPAQFTVEQQADELVVTLLGLDRAWCCRREVRVPLALVEGVAVDRRRQVPISGPRWPGAAIPGVITAGSYGFGPARSFWDVRGGEWVLRIELAPGAEYARLVLEPQDPHALALRLRDTLGAWVPILPRPVVPEGT